MTTSTLTNTSKKAWQISQKRFSLRFRLLALNHWSQVKKIRIKSRKLKNRAKLIENRQLKDLISP